MSSARAGILFLFLGLFQDRIKMCKIKGPRPSNRELRGGAKESLLLEPESMYVNPVKLGPAQVLELWTSDSGLTIFLLKSLVVTKVTEGGYFSC